MLYTQKQTCNKKNRKHIMDAQEDRMSGNFIKKKGGKGINETYMALYSQCDFQFL